MRSEILRASKGGPNKRIAESYVDFRKIIERDDIDRSLFGHAGSLARVRSSRLCKAEDKDVYCEKPFDADD